MDYREAIDYLESLMRFGIKLELDRISLLLRRLGDPHLRVPVVHIGGTNGKGSTAAMVASILKAAGYCTGLFTSPHLHSYTERFLTDGRPIPPEVFADLVAEIRPVVTQVAAETGEEPTEFEVLTALAFLYYARRKTDVLVLEVGMGGEYDATNVVPDPLVAIITNVGWDHMDRLGNTIAEIARAKAGIVKPGGWAVTAAEGEALAVIRERCRRVGARLFEVAECARVGSGELLPQGQRFDLKVFDRDYPNLFLPLLGEHQVKNAATAVVACEVASRFRGLAVPPEAVRRGLAEVRWPGRLERVGSHPAVILDVAHNWNAAEALRNSLEALGYHNHNLVLVLALLADKEREKIVGTLAPLARAVVVTRPLSPRAGAWEEVAELARAYAEEVYLEPEIPAAVTRACSLAGPDGTVVITGSFYMVGEARAFLTECGKTGGNAT